MTVTYTSNDKSKSRGQENQPEGSRPLPWRASSVNARGVLRNAAAFKN
jgi:hypothetical protein